jgi:hypothetical protein
MQHTEDLGDYGTRIGRNRGPIYLRREHQLGRNVTSGNRRHEFNEDLARLSRLTDGENMKEGITDLLMGRVQGGLHD